ncbi:DUF4157 domain-containing protein [Horticoccus sp. 23ND18S-11]|uniref:DUF4157 domain-containing protein n=1 Tax=Horticoccus sp. 23ND18S-11 TaxID=3391832 RepID=UPI0039C96B8E
MPARQPSPPIAHTEATPAPKPAPQEGVRTPAVEPAVGVPRFAASLCRAAARDPGEPPTPAALAGEAVRGPGQPLDGATQAAMSGRLGHDFSRVRVHADARTASAARALHARAYTVGSHVGFAAGTYAPHTPDGQQLLAHELVHTLQQRDARPAGAAPLSVAAYDGVHEDEAGRLAAGLQPGRAIAFPAYGPVTAGPVHVTPTSLQVACAPEAGQGGAAPNTPQARLEDAQNLVFTGSVRGTSTMDTLGFLRRQGVRIELRNVRSSFYEPKTHTLVLSEAGSAAEMATAIIFESYKIAGSAEPKDRAEFVQRGVQSAAESATRAIEFNLKLQADLEFNSSLKSKGVGSFKAPFEAEYTRAYQAAQSQVFAREVSRTGDPGQAAFRARLEAESAGAAAVREAVNRGQLVTGDTGLAYAEHLGKSFDTQQAERLRNEEEQRARNKIESDRRAVIDAGIAWLAKSIQEIDPNSPDAAHLVDALDHFITLSGVGEENALVTKAGDAMDRLLGPFGFRHVEGPGVGVLQSDRLAYAVMNYRRLDPLDRALLRRFPIEGHRFGIQMLPTQAELEKESLVVAYRKLPDGTLHQGTLAEFRIARENNLIIHALQQLNAVRHSSVFSLVGRIADGERGAAIGTMFDAMLAFRAPLRARQNQRQQMRNLGSGGTSSPRPTVGIYERAPTRLPMPAPRPVRVQDTEVVAINARAPANLRRQDPAAHQATWKKMGGEGPAPDAFRHAGRDVYVSSSSWLYRPATRQQLPLITGNGGNAPAQPAPKPATKPAQPAVPKRNIGLDDTAKMPAVDPYSKTGVAPASPAPAPTPAPATTSGGNSAPHQPASHLPNPVLGASSGGPKGGTRETYASKKPAFQQASQQLLPLIAQINPFGGLRNCVPVAIEADKAIATGKASPVSVRYTETGRQNVPTRHGDIPLQKLEEQSSTLGELEKYTGKNRQHGALYLHIKMHAAPEGSRVILVEFGTSINHAYNVVKVNGVVLAIDAQAQTIRPFDDVAREIKKAGDDWRMIWYRIK